MLPPSVGHKLKKNTIRDIKGDFLSNNKTRISIHVGNGSRRALKARRRSGRPSAAPCRGSPQIPSIADRKDWIFVRSREYQSDLVVHDGYRIHLAKYLGKVVAVKVYQGVNTVERLEADFELNKSLLHPTIFQTIAVSAGASHTPFVVLSMESDSSGTIGSFKSLACYLAGALSHSETESLVAGAQLIRDISSGLDYLASIEQIVAVSRLTFDLLVNENNNICISVGLKEEDEAGTQDGYLDVFYKLCLKTFVEANNECYVDKSQGPTLTAPEARYEPDLLFSESQGDPAVELNLESDYLPIEPRREYAFIPDRTLDGSSLRRISTDYARFMRGITRNIPHLRRKRGSSSIIVAHRCPGYRRDEVTLSPSVLRTAIIQHLTPSLREICPVCHQLVEDGIFDCSCGRDDDGISPTIKCSHCTVWSHRTCQMDGETNGGPRFSCTSCLSLESQSQPESAQIQDINSAFSSREEDIEVFIDPQDHDINQSHGYPVELEASPDSQELDSSNSEGDSLPAEVLSPVRVQPSARVRLAARVRLTTRAPPAEKWALLVAPGYDTDKLPTLDDVPDKAEKIKSLLVETLGYKEENIVVLTDRGVDPGNTLYPSEENVLRELKALIKPGEPNIEYFFFFGGHGERQEAEDDDESEEDLKDEAMLLPRGGRILDNELQAILVEPLRKTPDCRFLALVDARHSTIMDLPHFRCNRVYHPVISMVRRLSRRIKEGSSRSAPTLFGTSVISTIARTPPVMTENAISSSRMAAVISTIKRCTGFCLRGPEHGPRVICISACKDWRPAFERQGLPSMTQAFIDAIKRRPKLSLKELMHSIRHDVRFDQQAQMSSLEPLYMEAPLFLGLETVPVS